MPSRQRYAEEVCPFRSYFVYNNAMTSMASYIAEVIAGKPFETMVGPTIKTNCVNYISENMVFASQKSD